MLKNRISGGDLVRVRICYNKDGDLISPGHTRQLEKLMKKYGEDYYFKVDSSNGKAIWLREDDTILGYNVTRFVKYENDEDFLDEELFLI